MRTVFFYIMDWSLITGRGGGYKMRGRGGGGHAKFTPPKRGGGRKSFTHAEGGGGTTSVGAVFTQ